MLKKIPYGIADYQDIKDNNYYFIDKTKYIEKLEDLNERYLMFLRPRRFGKSLFLSMLHYYYDVNYKDRFKDFFGDSYIDKNPTSEANRYLIMRFNFSGIDINDVENSFRKYLLEELNSFISKYNLKVIIDENPIILFNTIFKYLQKNRLELMILIDEYDNFANKILLRERNEYLDLVSEKTASFKQLFTTLKTATDMENSPLKRIFITGVTPMIMFDVTSGFNIGANISLRAELNNMVGLNSDELDEILNYYKVDIDRNLLKEWYNNYKFNLNSEAIYNTDMILYFISNYQSENKIPDEMIDINVRSDYKKLRNIIYTNKKLNGNFKTLQTLIAGDSVSTPSLVQDFSAVNLEKDNNFKSLMFYMGLVTLKDRDLDINLKIPNETVKRIDIDFLTNALEMEKVFELEIHKLSESLKQFALNGSLEVFRYLAQEIKENTGIRDYIYNEQVVKSMYIAYLSLTPYYIIKSELEMNKGFSDIFIKPFNPYVKYVGLVEFKYIKKSDKATKEKINKFKQDATKQLKEYEQDSEVLEFISNGLLLKKVIVIFHGWELVFCEEIN